MDRSTMDRQKSFKKEMACAKKLQKGSRCMRTDKTLEKSFKKEENIQWTDMQQTDKKGF